MMKMRSQISVILLRLFNFNIMSKAIKILYFKNNKHYAGISQLLLKMLEQVIYQDF